jgi:hypothetical protein
MTKPTWKSLRKLLGVWTWKASSGVLVSYFDLTDILLVKEVFACLVMVNFIHLVTQNILRLQPNLFQLDMVSRSCKLWWPLLMTLFLLTTSLRTISKLSQPMSTFRAAILLLSTKFVSCLQHAWCSCFWFAIIFYVRVTVCFGLGVGIIL